MTIHPTDPTASSTTAPTTVEQPPRQGSGAGIWLWVIAAIIAVVALTVAVLGRDPGDGPTLRAMAASESMSDEQARAVADNTVRGWMREHNAGHLANLQALSCPDLPDGLVAAEIQAIGRHRSVDGEEVAATARLSRDGKTWTLDVFGLHNSWMFTLKILDGELRVCQIGSAPIP